MRETSRCRTLETRPRSRLNGGERQDQSALLVHRLRPPGAVSRTGPRRNVQASSPQATLRILDRLPALYRSRCGGGRSCDSAAVEPARRSMTWRRRRAATSSAAIQSRSILAVAGRAAGAMNASRAAIRRSTSSCVPAPRTRRTCSTLASVQRQTDRLPCMTRLPSRRPFAIHAMTVGTEMPRRPAACLVLRSDTSILYQNVHRGDDV